MGARYHKNSLTFTRFAHFLSVLLHVASSSVVSLLWRLLGVKCKMVSPCCVRFSNEGVAQEFFLNKGPHSSQ
jgi:hypothetical protein